MSFKLGLCTDKQIWNNFVSRSPQANVFCLTPFLDSLKQNYQLWLVKKNNQIHLGLIMFQKGKGKFTPCPQNFFMYQGLLLASFYKQQVVHRRTIETLKVVDFLLAQLEKGYDKIAFYLHPAFEDLRSFLWFHYHEPKKGQFKVNLKYTGLINLKQFSNFESYLKTIRKVRRYEYHQALKNKLRIGTSQDIEKLDYLHQLTFERQGIKRSKGSSKNLKNITKAALLRGFGELLFCKNTKEKVIGATLYLYDKKCGYYLVGANHPDYRNTGSGTFLMLENIRRCQDRGIHWVDVCGINSPNRGDFKASFNAEPIPYFEVTWEKPSKRL